MSEKFTILLSEQEIEVIGKALYELPFKMSASVISSIQNQIIEQKQKKEPTAPVRLQE